jgi:hypothetical protein
MKNRLNELPRLTRDFLRAESYKPNDVFYSITGFLPFARNRDVQNIASDALLKQVVPYYSKRGLKANTGVYNFLVEPLKNANFHGASKASVIHFEVFMTPLVLVASYNDKGNYFKRQEIKEAWENRIEFPERHQVSADVHDQGIGFGAGTGILYSLADLIEVDTSSGTLYTGWMAKRFCS